MTIKPQDIVVLAKLITYPVGKSWSQHMLAAELCLSPSQINSALKRLVITGLITPYRPPQQPQPIAQACKEFFSYGLKYIFPAKLGEVVRGIPTSYAGPALKDEIVMGSEPIPVWAYGEGDERGVSLKPLYASVPRAVITHPDIRFYELLTLLDAIRSGRAREKQIAIKKINDIFELNNERVLRDEEKR